MNEQTEQHAYTLHLTVGTHSARHVRRIVRALCEDWAIPADLGHDMALGVTELLSNVVRHVPGARAEVRLLHDPDTGHLRAEVSDEGAALPPEAPHSADPFAESGRGLAIVSAVATKWGVQPLVVGKTVWFVCVASSA